MSLAGLALLGVLGMGLPRYGAMGPNCWVDERVAGRLLGRLSPHTKCVPQVAHILLQLHAHVCEPWPRTSWAPDSAPLTLNLGPWVVQASCAGAAWARYCNGFFAGAAFGSLRRACGHGRLEHAIAVCVWKHFAPAWRAPQTSTRWLDVQVAFAVQCAHGQSGAGPECKQSLHERLAMGHIHDRKESQSGHLTTKANMHKPINGSCGRLEKVGLVDRSSVFFYDEVSDALECAKALLGTAPLCCPV